MIDIQVWTKSNCPQCVTTKKVMDKHHIIYRELSLEENPEALQSFIDQGFTSAPIVVTDRKIWSGFRLDKIKSLAMFLHSEESKL